MHGLAFTPHRNILTISIGLTAMAKQVVDALEVR